MHVKTMQSLSEEDPQYVENMNTYDTLMNLYRRYKARRWRLMEQYYPSLVEQLRQEQAFKVNRAVLKPYGMTMGASALLSGIGAYKMLRKSTSKGTEAASQRKRTRKAAQAPRKRPVVSKKKKGTRK